jgi:cytoskeletal protein CcmA (bactofilin family)
VLRKKQKPQNRIDSLIGVGTLIQGNVVFSGGMRIDGEVVGDVISAPDSKPTTLVLSENARVQGAIRVAHLVLNGTVDGPVNVSHYVELQSKSRVTGDVAYQLLEMQPGAIVEGRLIHLSDRPEAASSVDNATV